MKRWTIYRCPKGHVDTSTLRNVCWACYPGGRGPAEQVAIEVVEAAEYDRLREERDEAGAEWLRDRKALVRWESDALRYYGVAAELEDRLAEMREALSEAIEMVEDWGSYASDYFQEKHDLNGDIAKLREALHSTQQQEETG